MTDEQKVAWASLLRDRGYIDVGMGDPVETWISDVVEPALQTLAQLGFTVSPKDQSVGGDQ